MLRQIRRWRIQRILEREAIPEPQWQEAVRRLPLLAGLSADQLTQLRELVVLFLHEKELMTAADLELDRPMALHLALQACLPILDLGMDWYRGWRTIVVYPGDFLARHQYRDESGVEHEEQAAMAGEAWEQGPVVLSWADVAESGQLDGFNVVIHEFAHKLDMLNGEPNGFPPLHRGMSPSEWAEAFSAAYRDLSERVQRGDGELPLDAYAAESPAEFFSVVSEAFFELPGILACAYPQVYRQLTAFYRQDPGTRLARRCRDSRH